VSAALPVRVRPQPGRVGDCYGQPEKKAKNEIGPGAGNVAAPPIFFRTLWRFAV
jgi:hypothetical protein